MKITQVEPHRILQNNISQDYFAAIPQKQHSAVQLIKASPVFSSQSLFTPYQSPVKPEAPSQDKILSPHPNSNYNIYEAIKRVSLYPKFQPLGIQNNYD
jgi:hypothetical protein